MTHFFYLCVACQRRIDYPDDCYNDLHGNRYCSLDCLYAEADECF